MAGAHHGRPPLFGRGGGSALDADLKDGVEPADVCAGRRWSWSAIGPVDEEVKYGGILFSLHGVQVGGVFVYAEHVSVEFTKGALIPDAHGFLEGSGKGRRHVKLRTPEDIDGKRLAAYLPLALEASLG